MPKNIVYVKVPQPYLSMKELGGMEKLTLGLLILLCKKTGSAPAKNEYLAETLGLSTQRIAHILMELKAKGYLGITLVRDNKLQVKKRTFLFFKDGQDITSLVMSKTTSHRNDK